MAGLLVYGSLMHPDELAPHVARDRRVVPVRAQGFRRSFEQEPSWRKGEVGKRGVLTVRPSPGHWINGVVVQGYDARDLRSLDQRERGYTRESVPVTAVEPYPPLRETGPASDRLSASTPIDDEIAIYVGRNELLNPDLLPNPAYLELCVEAARRLGAEFLDDFLATTFVGSRVLADVARARRVAGEDV